MEGLTCVLQPLMALKPCNMITMTWCANCRCLHAREYHRDCLRPLLKLMLTKVIGRSYIQEKQAEEAELKEKSSPDAETHTIN